mmetsp:Transcript_41377/g.81059  ORF Transcript_41377/g.81059 Transcript_41377/m.81059 type:complete len:446 (+) Transcript_41377:190-1527(+)
MEFRALLHDIDDKLIGGYTTLLQECTAYSKNNDGDEPHLSIFLPALELPDEDPNLIPPVVPVVCPEPSTAPTMLVEAICAPRVEDIDGEPPPSMMGWDGGISQRAPPTAPVSSHVPPPAVFHPPTVDPVLLSPYLDGGPISPSAPSLKFRAPASSAAKVAKCLAGLRTDVAALRPRIDQLAGRLKKGVIPGSTGARPRYGPSAVRKHVALVNRFRSAEGVLTSTEADGALRVLTDSAKAVAAKEAEKAIAELRAEEERIRAEREATEAADGERARRREEEIRMARELDEREAELRADAEADRAFQASVSVGREGMEHSLDLLRKGTIEVDNSDELLAMVNAEDYKGALRTLHKLVNQLVKHPEEENHRRIRRDHEGFIRDIGRFAGGIEFLIAVGFGFSMVEGVKSLVCREPNLEKELDAWSKWYDRLKLALTILEEEISKSSQL